MRAIDILIQAAAIIAIGWAVGEVWAGTAPEIPGLVIIAAIAALWFSSKRYMEER